MEAEFEDFVVVYWSPDRGIGTARPPHAPHRSRNGLFFGSRGILTVGEETLRPGSWIRGHRIPDPKYPERDQIVDIEIYTSKPERVKG